MLQKTELLKVTVEDLDGEQPAEPAAPVNILREKTFNPELSSLLNKIYSHEKTSGVEAPVIEKIDPVLKINLLQKCDQLLYKIKHESEAASVSSYYNPFTQDINVYDDIDDLNEYIETGMRQSGFSRFLIMKYNFKDAAFRTDINRIDEILTSDLFFSTRDSFFISMYENNTGHILDHSSVNDDIFLTKKLGRIFRTDDNNKVIYFVRLCSLCNDDERTLKMKKSMSSFEEYLSPIIAVIPDNGKDHLTETDFFNTLKANLQIPFALYTLKNRINFNTQHFSYEDTLLMLELVMSSPVADTMTCSLLTLDNFSIKENMFILKFLLSKIRKNLEKDSFFMRISIDKCILITSEKEKREIVSMIDEINISDKIISIKPIVTGKGADADSFTAFFL